MELPTTLAETVKKLAREYIREQAKTIAEGMGGRASDAVKLSADEELQAWMRATASPEEVAAMIEAGDDDKTIFQKARGYRYALGRAAGKGDPKKEAEYHEKMAQKAQAFLAAQQQPAPVSAVETLSTALGQGQGQARPTAPLGV